MIEEALLILKHFRNAIAHPEMGIILLKKENKVRIRDFDERKNVFTYDKNFTFHELWLIVYLLTILDNELDPITLTFTVFRQIRELNKRYLVVKCTICGEYVAFYI